MSLVTYLRRIAIMKPLALFVRVFLLIVAFVIVVYSIYNLKSQGLGRATQSALGVDASDPPEIRGKVINNLEKNPEASSQTEDSPSKN